MQVEIGSRWTANDPRDVRTVEVIEVGETHARVFNVDKPKVRTSVRLTSFGIKTQRGFSPAAKAVE